MTTNNINNGTDNQSPEDSINNLLPSQSVLGEPEPWESWETSLCLWSIGLGITALIILGTLVNWFLLPK